MVGAKCGGEIVSTEGDRITAGELVWRTSHGPGIDRNPGYTSEGLGLSVSGKFTSAITGPIPGTIYYVRVYAVNAAGAAYGEERVFKSDDAIADMSGNSYKVAKIGGQYPMGPFRIGLRWTLKCSVLQVGVCRAMATGRHPSMSWSAWSRPVSK